MTQTRQAGLGRRIIRCSRRAAVAGEIFSSPSSRLSAERVPSRWHSSSRSNEAQRRASPGRAFCAHGQRSHSTHGAVSSVHRDARCRPCSPGARRRLHARPRAPEASDHGAGAMARSAPRLHRARVPGPRPGDRRGRRRCGRTPACPHVGHRARRRPQWSLRHQRPVATTNRHMAGLAATLDPAWGGSHTGSKRNLAGRSGAGDRSTREGTGVPRRARRSIKSGAQSARRRQVSANVRFRMLPATGSALRVRPLIAAGRRASGDPERRLYG